MANEYERVELSPTWVVAGAADSEAVRTAPVPTETAYPPKAVELTDHVAFTVLLPAEENDW